MKRIGIDLGGSMAKGGLVSNGVIERQRLWKTRFLKGREDILEGLFHIISDLKEGEDIEQIGVCSCGDIDPISGICLRSDNLREWSGTPIKERIEARFGIPTYVENDAIGALIGEASYFKEDSLLMLTFGTGVGSAFLKDGHIVRDGSAAFGLLKAKVGEHEVSFEELLCTNALKRIAFRSFGFHVQTMRIFEKAREGNKRAVKALDIYVSRLNAFLELIFFKAHPKRILLGGGLMNSKDEIGKRLHFSKDRVSFAHFGNDAGMIGASLLPMNEK